MKKGTKITLIVLGSILALFVLLFLCADMIISRTVNNKMPELLALVPQEAGQVSCGPVHVRLFSGTAEVKDIRYTYHHAKKVHKKDSVAPGIEVHVDRVEVGHVFYTLLLGKEVVLSDLRIVRPTAELWLDDKHPEHSFPNLPKDEKAEPQPFPLSRIELMSLHVKNASMRYHSLRTPLNAKVDSLSLTVNHLSFDSAFHYCDSLYSFALGHATMTTPDGLMFIETSNIKQEDAGPLTIGRTHIKNTISHTEMAERANEPVTWMDMHLASAQIGAFNPVRKVLAQDWTFGEVKAVVSHMNVVRDLTHKPLAPYRMLQEEMLDIPVPFRVAKINGEIKKLNITLALTPKKAGKMTMEKIHASITNLTNTRDAVMKVSGGLPLGEGEANVAIDLMMNENSDYTMTMTGHDADVSFINDFVYPIAGMKLACAVDRLDMHQVGDKVKTTGTFCLQYHDLKVLENNAAGFVNAILPVQNPDKHKTEPRAYKTKWKKEPKQEFAFYLFGPMIDGVIKTLLPGANMHELVPYKPVE